MCDNEVEVLAEHELDIDTGKEPDIIKIKLWRYKDDVCKNCNLPIEDRCKDMTEPVLEFEDYSGDLIGNKAIPKLFEIFNEINEVYLKEIRLDKK